jgi:MinD-like ATPase involved in chromosome partitioning or flagellar assembly
MGIILYIGNSKEIADNIDNFKSCNHRLTVLNLQYNYKHYIEEYMPDYILLSDKIEGFTEISDYVSLESDSKLIITGNNRINDSIVTGAARIECPETWERFQKIIETIDIVDPTEKKEGKQYKFLKQEVMSFYSIQGGTGKTSIAFNAAYLFRKKEMGKVLLIDLNFCEGPSDMQIALGTSGKQNLGDYADDAFSGDADLKKYILSIDGIDLLCPPGSLYRGEGFGIEMLADLIYSARNEYDLIIADLPFRYDNISLEMINISTISVLVLSPDVRMIPRIKAFNKFLPGNQKKLAVLNKTCDSTGFIADELDDMTGITLMGRVPFIAKTDRDYINRIGRPTGIIDLQPAVEGLLNKVY